MIETFGCVAPRLSPAQYCQYLTDTELPQRDTNDDHHSGQEDLQCAPSDRRELAQHSDRVESARWTAVITRKSYSAKEREARRRSGGHEEDCMRHNEIWSANCVDQSITKRGVIATLDRKLSNCKLMQGSGVLLHRIRWQNDTGMKL